MNLRRTTAALAVLAAFCFGMTACQMGVSMWGACSPSSTGNPFGTDGEWVLICRNGTWEPVMTVEEYLRIRRGEHVTRQPLPSRPTTTSTTTTTTLPPATIDVEHTAVQFGAWLVGGCIVSDLTPRRDYQTFIAGRTGELTEVGFMIWSEGIEPELTVGISAVSGGVPTGPLQGVVTSTPASNPDDFVDIPLGAPVDVVAGQSYAIVLSTADTTCPTDGQWKTRGSNDAYPDGLAGHDAGFGWEQGGTFDMQFRTWVRS